MLREQNQHNSLHSQPPKHPIQLIPLPTLPGTVCTPSLLRPPLSTPLIIQQSLPLRPNPLINILRLKNMHPTIQPSRGHTPLLRKFLCLPPRPILLQRLSRLSLQLRKVVLQRDAAA